MRVFAVHYSTFIEKIVIIVFPEKDRLFWREPLKLCKVRRKRSRVKANPRHTPQRPKAYPTWPCSLNGHKKCNPFVTVSMLVVLRTPNYQTGSTFQGNMPEFMFFCPIGISLKKTRTTTTNLPLGPLRRIYSIQYTVYQ